TAEIDRSTALADEVLAYDHAANRWTALIAAGMPAPGGGVFESADSFGAINNGGDIVVSGKITKSSAGPKGSGLFLVSGGNALPIVRPGLKLAAGTLNKAWRPHLSDSGIITFEGGFTGSMNVAAYMVVRNGTITELAASGNPAPGGSDPFVTLHSPQANSSGD